MKNSQGQRVLGITFFLTLAFCIFEFIGGKISGSLALIADASHMITDMSALALALFAGWMSGKQATPKMSFGFYRLEILAALVNGTTLVTLAIFIVIEAFRRLSAEAQPIQTHLMLGVAVVGLILNIVCAVMLHRSSSHDINLRGVFFHVLADGMSSIATVIAGVVILQTGWRYADPVASFAVAMLIVASAWRLLKDVVEVLLEATPAHIDTEILEKKILTLPGVEAIHDLHVWSLTKGKESLSAHVEVVKGTDSDRLLSCMNEILARDFNIHHTTLQIEASQTVKPPCADENKNGKNHFHH